jgi:membrane glycosyltransferase
MCPVQVQQLRRGGAVSRGRLHGTWEKTAGARRVFLLILIFVPTIIASGFLAQTLPHKGATPLELLLVIFFAILYAWISNGFWTSTAGFFALMRRHDRFIAADRSETAERAGGRTAVLMPIFNEKVDRVYAGLYTVFRSLERTGHIDSYDFFILSDSTDGDRWVEEEAAWNDLCEAVQGHGRIFYRNRRVHIKRKSGNIADFCRRWGANFRYMIVLDADSIMTGPAMVTMTAIMERNPSVGILQTFPKAANAQTLFARLQQFAGNLYGPMFAAGLHFWQLGDAQYWGHNAIIRIEPFMKHCALPLLSGSPPLGGEILSHDFVEAALMRRAGWSVWLAHGIEGSYEEMPPSLADDLGRDRRWCQGNLQHLRLLFTKGLIPVHRVLFFLGAMAYVSGLLWFLFLAISTTEAISEALSVYVYFPHRYSLFPDWPVWNPAWAIALVSSTAMLLFLPKFLCLVVVALKQRRTSEYGGMVRLLASMAAEIFLSTLFAPVRMIFHSKFVFDTLLGRRVGWSAQQREEHALSWSESMRLHGPGMVFGFAWGAVVLLITPSFFWWLVPIIASLILSVPFSVWTSRSAVGERSGKLGLFLSPEEIAPAGEFGMLEGYLQGYRRCRSPLAIDKTQGFIRAVVDPCVHVLHLSLLRKERSYSGKILERRESLRRKAMQNGPEGLSASEKKELLSDPASLIALHREVWQTTDEAIARMWGISLLNCHRR